MRIKTIYITLTILTALGTVALFAAEHSLKGKVSYTASGPTGSWTGSNTNLSGRVTLSPPGGKICISMTSWDSGNTRRDNHAKDMFEADKFPEACFYPGSIGASSISGELEMHGVRKPVTFTGSYTTSGGEARFKGTTTVSIDAFGMTRPAMMGMKVKDEVQLEVSVTGVAAK